MKKTLFRSAILRGMSPIERAKGRYMRAPDGHFEGKSAAEIGTWIRERMASNGQLTSELKSRIEELEQRADRPIGRGGFETKSYGSQVAENREVKEFLDARRQTGSVRVELKAITTGSSEGLRYAAYEHEIAGKPKRAYRVRDLLDVVPTKAGMIGYAEQTARENNATPVLEGTQKPYSNYGWATKMVQMKTIAHLAKLTRQAMDDSDQLGAEVDSEMRYGLQLVEDAQILNGDGTGENLLGLRPQATSYAAPAGYVLPSNPTRIDTIGAAILVQLLTDYPADGIVLHPVDWMIIRQTKNSAGEYLFGDPGADVEPRLFGLPVAATQAQTVGNYLIGGFKLQKLYDRMAPEVLISSENDRDFELNLLTMRAEQRLGLAAKKKAALIKGTFV